MRPARPTGTERFSFRVYPPFSFTLGGSVLCDLYYTIKFVVNQIHAPSQMVSEKGNSRIIFFAY